MAAFYNRFIQETFSPEGTIRACSYVYDDNFNYGYDVIDAIAQLSPDKIAMLWRNDKGERRDLTFGELRDLSNQVANLLAARGLKKGDTLMAVLRTHWEYWVAAIAAHKLGLLLSPVYYRLTAEDIRYRMEKAGAKGVITCRDGDADRHVLEAAQQTGVDLRFSIGGAAPGFEDFHACIQDQPTAMERVETHCMDPMLVYFTSGTTGQPKAVLHNHLYALGNHCGARYMQDISETSIHFATGDTGWEVVGGTKFYGQWLNLGCLLVIDYDRFPPELVLEILAREKATGILLQPTVYRMLTDVGMDQYDLSSLTNCAVGGEKLQDDLAQTVLQQTGHVLYEGYAQSETNLIAAASKNMGRKDGSVGCVLPKYHVELLKEDGTFAAPGEEGEIVIVADHGVRPIGIMMGYLNDDEANRRLWDGNLFRTGDLAVKDEDNFLFFRGRSDGIIKTKGYRVSPMEIENALTLHPAVRECLAVGVPDRDMGQRVKVYVVPEAGYTPGEALEQELLAFHNEGCAGFKKIRELAFVPTLARNSNGKIIRSQFKDAE